MTLPGSTAAMGRTSARSRASLFILVGAISVGEATAQEAPAAPQAPAWLVYQFLRTHCAECHGGHLDRPKAELGYILDLPRLIDEAYVIPGEPENSDLFIALTTDDPDFSMPPDDAESPKPDAEGIERVRQWIADGAPVFTDRDDSGNADVETGDEAPAEADGAGMSLARKIGRFHPLLVHFPIAFLLGAGFAAVASRVRPAAAWPRGLVRGALWAGALGAVFAAGCGWLNARFEGFVGDSVDTHRWLGVTTAGAALVALLLWERIERRRESAGSRIQLVGLAIVIVVAILVTVAGHTGGRLSFGEDYLPFF